MLLCVLVLLRLQNGQFFHFKALAKQENISPLAYPGHNTKWIIFKFSRAEKVKTTER